MPGVRMPLLLPLLLDMVSHHMGALFAGGRIRVDEVKSLAFGRLIVPLLPFKPQVLEVFAGAP